MPTACATAGRCLGSPTPHRRRRRDESAGEGSSLAPARGAGLITDPLTLDGGVVLALGGGGTRGLAHLGVLAELHAAGVSVRAIAGTSSGALTGAMWLTLGTEGAVARVHEFIHAGYGRRMLDLGGDYPETGLRGLLRRGGHAVALAKALVTRHVLNQQQVLERIAFLLPDGALEGLRVPLVVVATDSASGDEVRLTRGSLRLAIAASSAMPGLVAPFSIGGRRLQDGGAVAEIPVGAARELGSPVVAVEVSEGLPAGRPDEDRLARSMFRAAAMGWQALRRRMLADADAVIAPAVNHLHWADYHAVDEAVEAGRAAAREFLEGRRV